jgi:hypothetical protein
MPIYMVYVDTHTHKRAHLKDIKDEAEERRSEFLANLNEKIENLKRMNLF